MENILLMKFLVGISSMVDVQLPGLPESQLTDVVIAKATPVF